MVLITRNDVPVYLQSSAFYTSLDEDDQLEFEVPDDCFKRNDQIYSTSDLYYLLKTASFWGIDNVAAIIVPFMFLHSPDSKLMNELRVSFPEYQGILNNLIVVKRTEPTRAIEQAIFFGLGLSVVKFLYQHEGYSLSSEACAAAVAMKYLPLLSYLHEQKCPWNDCTTRGAICSGNVDALNYACANGCPLPHNAMRTAALLGSVAVMRLLNSFGVPYPEVVYLNLGNLTSIQHLRSVGCEWHTINCTNYARMGKLECLQYAHENGCPWSATACAAAARYGRLACLRYLHEHDCPWDAQTMADAAQFGEFECLKYACEHGCPVDFLAPNHACAYRQWRCLAYMLRYCSLYATFGVILLALFVVLMVAGLAVLIAKGAECTIYDYANFGSILCWCAQFVLLVYGPRCLSGNIALQEKLHCLLGVIWFCVNIVMIATGPIVALVLQAFGILYRSAVTFFC